MIKISHMRNSSIGRLRNHGFNIPKSISYHALAGIINKASGWVEWEIEDKRKSSSKKIIKKFYTKKPDLGPVFPFDFFVKPNGNKSKKKKKELEFCQTDEFLQSFEWRRLRYEVLKENDGRCELCGRNKHDGIVLNVDHIKPRKTNPELALEVSNLQILCNECNHGKGNIDDTDWRNVQSDDIERFVRLIAEKNPSVAANLQTCKLDRDNSCLEIVASSDFSWRMIKREKNMAVVKRAGREVFGDGLSVNLSNRSFGDKKWAACLNSLIL